MTNKTFGKYGENLAKDFLIKKGFTILELNYHYSKIAEIDIIASKKDTLHFIEVKTRSQTFFGSPLEAITEKKLNQIYNCAKHYISIQNKHYKTIQIDAIGIVLDKNNNAQITFLENLSI